MNVFKGKSKRQKDARFGWLRHTNLDETEQGLTRFNAMRFLQACGNHSGDIYESMQAAIDTDTPYARDLALRLMTAILEGKIP